MSEKKECTIAKSITIESIQAFYFDALYLNNNCFAIAIKKNSTTTAAAEEEGARKKHTHKFKRIHTENNVIRNLCCEIKDEMENYGNIKFA